MAKFLWFRLASVYFTFIVAADIMRYCGAQTLTTDAMTTAYKTSRLYTTITDRSTTDADTDPITPESTAQTTVVETTKQTSLLTTILKSTNTPTTTMATTRNIPTTTVATTVDSMTSTTPTTTQPITTSVTTTPMVSTSGTTESMIRTTTSPTTTSQLLTTTSQQTTPTSQKTTTTSQPQTQPGKSTTSKETSAAAPSTAAKHTTPKSQTTQSKPIVATTIGSQTEITNATTPSSTEGSPPASSDLNVGVIIIVVVVVVLVVLAVVFGLYHYRRSRANGADVSELTENAMRMAPLGKANSLMRRSMEKEGTLPRTNLDQRRSLYFNRRSLALGDILGKGSYTQVMRGQAWKIVADKAVSDVAIKMLKDNATAVDRMRLLSELETMRKLIKPPKSIMPLLGYCNDEEPIYILYEFSLHGTLQSYLREMQSKFYGKDTGVIVESKFKLTRTLLGFAEDIADGMTYLHNNDIVHGDLSSLSIFVSEGITCQISDIGKHAKTSSSESDMSISRIVDVPLRWMAPEVLNNNDMTSKSDVWAFGIVLWEIVTLGATPYSDIKSSHQVKGYVFGGGRLAKPEHCSNDFFNLMTKCWLEDPKQRTTCKSAYRKIQQFKENDIEHLNMDDFQQDSYGTIEEPMGHERC